MMRRNLVSVVLQGSANGSLHRMLCVVICYFEVLEDRNDGCVCMPFR